MPSGFETIKGYDWLIEIDQECGHYIASCSALKQVVQGKDYAEMRETLDEVLLELIKDLREDGVPGTDAEVLSWYQRTLASQNLPNCS